jgi:hypothetical protein
MSHSLRALSQEGSRPAADPAGAGHYRGDLGWAAAGGGDIGGVDEAICGEVGRAAQDMET